MYVCMCVYGCFVCTDCDIQDGACIGKKGASWATICDLIFQRAIGIKAWEMTGHLRENLFLKRTEVQLSVPDWLAFNTF